MDVRVEEILLLVTKHAMKLDNSTLFFRSEGTPFNVGAKIVWPPEPTALSASTET